MPSPFASRLGTNYCPSDEEVINIRTFLIEPKSRLKRLDDKIADLQKAIDSLTEERASVRSFVDAHDALISPIRRIPLDIVQEIFVACLPTHRNCVMSAVEAPLLLGRICSSWRAIALSTPRLWARLHIVEPEYDGIVPSNVILEEKVAQRIDAVKTWLTRSGVCPISISLEGVRPTPMPTGIFAPSSTRLFLQALILFSSRWQDVTMSFVFSLEPLETLFGLAETDVPMLSKFRIVQQEHRDQPGLPWRSFAVLRTPTLSDLAFIGYQANPLELPVQWTNITTLSLTGMLRPNLILVILSKCPQIRTCRFGLSYAAEDVSLDTNHSVVEHTNLRSLQVTGWLDGITGILRPLLVPALREFGLNGNMSTLDSTHASHFTAFLARCQRLEDLDINTYLFDNISLLELLHNLPTTVKRLCIANYAYSGHRDVFDDDALAMLTPSSADASLSCPSLQELKIIGNVFPTDEAMVRFITARMDAEPPVNRTLKRVEIQLSRSMEFDIRPRIQPFLDAGLQLHTTYHPPPTGQMYSVWRGLIDEHDPR